MPLCRLLQMQQEIFFRHGILNIIISRKQDLEICAHCQKHKSDLENAAALESDAVRYKIRGVIQNAPQQQQGERYYIQQQQRERRERERDWCLCVYYCQLSRGLGQIKPAVAERPLSENSSVILNTSWCTLYLCQRCKIWATAAAPRREDERTVAAAAGPSLYGRPQNHLSLRLSLTIPEEIEIKRRYCHDGAENWIVSLQAGSAQKEALDGWLATLPPAQKNSGYSLFAFFARTHKIPWCSSIYLWYTHHDVDT